MDPVLLAQAYPDSPSAWDQHQPQPAHIPGADLADAPLPRWETVD